MSPLPISFSAPAMSRIVLESTWLVTANAMRLGILALISPVMTSTEGLCVAMIRWMPAALASCASRQIAVSTSFLATIIRSASSSTMTTILESTFSFSPASSPLALTSALYPLRSLVPDFAKSAYLRSISATAQLRAADAFLTSVTTGIIRCGIPL